MEGLEGRCWRTILRNWEVVGRLYFYSFLTSLCTIVFLQSSTTIPFVMRLIIIRFIASTYSESYNIYICVFKDKMDRLYYIQHRCRLQLYLDTKVSLLSSCVQVVGEDRVVLGSDYPFPLGEHHPGSLIQSADLPDATKQKLLYTNALEFLNLEPSTFQ